MSSFSTYSTNIVCSPKQGVPWVLLNVSSTGTSTLCVQVLTFLLFFSDLKCFFPQDLFSCDSSPVPEQEQIFQHVSVDDDLKVLI